MVTSSAMEVYECYLISQGRIKCFGALLRSSQRPPVAHRGGPGISVLAPLSGVKQTSGERVEDDANDVVDDARSPASNVPKGYR
jgi:hypothetical protein